MKIKLKTPDEAVLAFNRRELMVVNNCLNEACHGLLLDRFIPVHEELLNMLDCTQSVYNNKETFNLKAVA
jgi:hypothetical protein